MVRVSAGLKEWTRCLLDIADEAADNTDAPAGPKPGGDPMLQVDTTIYGLFQVLLFLLFYILANQIGVKNNKSGYSG